MAHKQRIEWIVSLEKLIDTLYKMKVMISDVSTCVSVNLTCKYYRFYLDHYTEGVVICERVHCLFADRWGKKS